MSNGDLPESWRARGGILTLLERDAIRLAHRVALRLEDRAPIVTVANVLTEEPWNLSFHEACNRVGAALRQANPNPRERT